MIYIYKCGGPIEAQCWTVDEAVKLCNEMELKANDGVCRCGWQEGKLVADAEGPTGQHYGSPPYDAATATGMYDAW